MVRRDLFAAIAPRTASTAPVAPAPRPAPVPPALRYVGFVADGAGRRVLLSGTSGVVQVTEGDVLPGGWRIDRIEAERILVRSLFEDSIAEIPRSR